ncbi:hypothetical protein H8788_23810 [Parabacteroides faecis]|uniref:hypothetical protein n=1 Tax=Parabacteroides TaxID=375288 RepID=UPI000EFDE6F9|nr:MULTISPECIES: hypothetical protein [Parabacteroides]MBC8620763.1 hypothetical protein [Parabacteroides faecis]RHR92753.1 hypothetical protein DWW23_23540 [Parabacteroides sp. AF14-59]
MAEGERILGKVAFRDKGTYSATVKYAMFDFIGTDDSCYLSIKDNNIGHPVTDIAWWKCLADGKPATAAAAKALAEGENAKKMASNASQATSRAESATIKAAQATTDAKAATEETLATAVEAEKMIVSGHQQIESMKAAESSLMSQALLAPARMELTYNKVITRRNPFVQYVAARLFPSYVLQNVIYQQPVNGGDSVYVEPDGKLAINKAGHTKIHVIPTNNTKLYQTIDVEVQEPAMRLTGDGAIRLNSDGSIRLT